MITGYGMVNGLRAARAGQGRQRPVAELDDGDARIHRAHCRSVPKSARLIRPFSSGYPQYTLDIDAARCERSGISPSDVLATISGYYGGQYVSNFNRFSKLYRVMIQADPSYRATPSR